MAEQAKVLLLTGAAGGLGPGIARRLAEAGYELALHAHRQRERVVQLQQSLRASGQACCVSFGDLTEPDIAEQAVQNAEQELGPLYGLLHLAGPYVARPILEHSREDFDRMIGGNLTSYFETLRAVLPGMRRRRRGRIIGVGMVGAQHTNPMPDNGPHLAAKAGLVALTRTLALEQAELGITANVINPGHIIHKELSRKQARSKPAGADHPLGVHGSYEDIADAALFLLSEGASYLTGAVLDVTGGWSGRYTMDPPKPNGPAEPA